MTDSQEVSKDEKDEADAAYERAERRARELISQGFNMGVRKRVSRDELHER